MINRMRWLWVRRLQHRAAIDLARHRERRHAATLDFAGTRLEPGRRAA